MAENKEELKSLDESEIGEGKTWLYTQHSKNEDHGIWSHHFMANRWGNNGNSDRLFTWAPKSLWMVTAARKLKELLAPWKKSNDKLRQHIKKQRHFFAYKAPQSQSYGFSSSHVWMWEFDHKECWASKNCCLVLEKTLESPLDCREIISVNPKETNLEYSLEGLMLKLKLQYSGHSGHFMQRADSLENTLMLGKTEGRRRRGHQRMRWLDGSLNNGHEFEQALGDGDGQRSLTCFTKSTGLQRVRHNWVTEQNLDLRITLGSELAWPIGTLDSSNMLWQKKGANYYSGTEAVIWTLLPWHLHEQTIIY